MAGALTGVSIPLPCALVNGEAHAVVNIKGAQIYVQDCSLTQQGARQSLVFLSGSLEACVVAKSCPTPKSQCVYTVALRLLAAQQLEHATMTSAPSKSASHSTISATLINQTDSSSYWVCPWALNACVQLVDAPACNKRKSASTMTGLAAYFVSYSNMRASPDLRVSSFVHDGRDGQCGANTTDHTLSMSGRGPVHIRGLVSKAVSPLAVQPTLSVQLSDQIMYNLSWRTAGRIRHDGRGAKATPEGVAPAGCFIGSMAVSIAGRGSLEVVGMAASGLQ
eukprot:6100189-Pyramimonas_sp.AAC.1